MIDLFGNKITEEDFIIHKIHGKYKKWKYDNNYRKSEDQEKRCKNCLNLFGFSYHHKNYYKCDVMGCSHSVASDIRLSYVCDQFFKKEKNYEIN